MEDWTWGVIMLLVHDFFLPWMLSVFFVGTGLFWVSQNIHEATLKGVDSPRKRRGKGDAINQNTPENRAESRKEKDWFSNFQPSILLTAFAVLLFVSGRVAFSVFMFFSLNIKNLNTKKQCIPHTWDLSTSGWWSLSALFEPCSIRLAIPWGSWQLGFMKSRSHPWAVLRHKEAL